MYRIQTIATTDSRFQSSGLPLETDTSDYTPHVCAYENQRIGTNC